MSADRMTPRSGAEADFPIADRAPGEIWLRGNPRPALAVFVAAATAAAVGVVVASMREPAWAWGLAAVFIPLLAAAAALARAAARPRLMRRGSTLEVRLSPLGVHRVPLEIVECVFPGFQPLGGGEDGGAAVAPRRVNTLVVRLAERATEWRARPVTAAWGGWDDGTIVFDGRWCEPLSPALVRHIAARLVDAKREAAGDREPS